MNKIYTKNGVIQTPSFLPDATYGSIRNVSFNDLEKTGINEVVTTTLHLEQKLGSNYIKKMGGLHKFFGWDKPILTDSGGWQVFSLINSERGNKKNKITELGCSFIDPTNGEYSLLTPESSIKIQLNMNPDVVTVLDDPIIVNASRNQRIESVRINTNWAKRSKKEFMKILNLESFNAYKFNSEALDRPLIGCVVQGGDDFELRKQSAEELLEIDFDLFNFGGVPLLSEVTWKTDYPEGFYKEMLHYVSELIPKNKIKYAMGVGQPEDIAFCVEKGWHIFDTVLPTRNARHGYLYVSESEGDKNIEYKNYSYDVMHLKSKRYEYDDKPVDKECDCECCSTVSRAYLRHLIRIKESAGFRLATIHNLRFYARWMEMLREKHSVS